MITRNAALASVSSFPRIPLLRGSYQMRIHYFPQVRPRQSENCKNSPTFFSGGCHGAHSFAYTQKEGGRESVFEKPSRAAVNKRKTTGVSTHLLWPCHQPSVLLANASPTTRMIQKVCSMEHGAELEECKICHQHSSLSSVASYYLPPRHSRHAGSCIT